MKIQSEDFLNVDDEKKEKMINMIVELETHNSFSKDCLVAVVKYQQEKIEMLNNNFIKKRWKMQELIKKIKQWAIDREIDKKGTIEGQSIKTAEEIAELIKGISKDNIDLIKDSIGDIFVTLVIGNMLDRKFDIEELIKYAKDWIVGDEIEWEKDILVARLGSSISDIANYKYDDDDIEFTLTVIIYASQFYNLDFKDCVESAYNEIANRKGKMIDGTFVKEGDY